MASFGAEFNRVEYSRDLSEYWRRINESQGFDIEGIVGPKGMVTSGQLISYKCEGLGSSCYPFGQKVKYYGKLGLHRYNLIHGTNFELQDLIKFNMCYGGASSFYITLEARDKVTSGPLQIFQVCADEQEFGCLHVVCSIARIKGDETTSVFAPPEIYDSVHRALPDWPSDAEMQRLFMVDRSELLNTHWIHFYLELLLCIKFGNFSEELNVSNLEFVNVVIETDNETPLKAKSSVLYIVFRGLAIDGTNESVERKAIIKSMFNELTGSLTLHGIVCKGEHDVAPISTEEHFNIPLPNVS
ncbi:unnamed protein product [Eruca vesicaria subsp. sativa]|uniref:Uncharacterized protein n=1 Tax=Eruca vesicaria subsp. sativa TaxID=29727 RepID=A0ABC8LX72_ERUVS|nr:unnamed protein product [Eruca vesicaria subsp. sativa]